MARNTADAARYFLNGDHKRITQKHGPTDAKSNLRAGLAVRPYARRIVVGGASDQAWTKARQQTDLFRLSFTLLAGCNLIPF